MPPAGTAPRWPGSPAARRTTTPFPTSPTNSSAAWRTTNGSPPPAPRSAGCAERSALPADPDTTTFRELEALPTDPDELLRKIYADAKGEGAQTRQSAALETIGDMLDDATLLPRLDSALYRAAAKIPGVSVVENAEDFTGRSGIGLSFEDRGGRQVWVFDKKSLDYLGSDKEALLGTAVADEPGREPGN